ncbi:hypothetical protein POL68_28125 [Stigmatella sp. ncwal1]|uniref:Peptidase C51 domain-containing protein n=1 Tax=Stigmatella ashevillensis TaxID=2995309 RepID=A0ABT5DGY4_9BACT|nr:hypothetical protein [Stigmatella ashevillena]MDC0712363.1 hypothetical protein [Stigmatella ashevillena]
MAIGGTSQSGSSGGVSQGHKTSQVQSPAPDRQAVRTPPAKKAAPPPKDTFEAGPTNQRIKSAVVQLNPKGRYQAANGSTFCNRFAADYANVLGDASLKNKTANQQFNHLNTPGSGYHKATAAEAMQAAAQGKIAFAAYQNPSGHGHIAAVVGQTAGKPAIAQAGKTNYDFVGVNYGFSKQHAPSYFVHD